MRKTLRIARREYNAQVRTKGFLIGLALAPLFACGGLIAFALLKDHVDVTDQHIALVDRSGLLAEYLVEEAEKRNAKWVHDEETGEKKRPAYVFEIMPPGTEGDDGLQIALSDRVRNKELFAYVMIGGGVLHPDVNPDDSRITYHSMTPLNMDARNWMYGLVNRRLSELRAKEAELDKTLIDKVMRRIGIESLGLVSVDKDTGKVTDARRTNEAEAVFIPMVMMMLLFMMMMWGAMPLISSVVEEKSQRIAEILLGSVSPFGMMMGKLLGGVGVSLTSAAVYLTAGIIVVHQVGIADTIPFHVLPWFVVYMLTAILMFGALLSAVGSACSEQSEAQAMMPFVMIPMLIPMFVWFIVVKEPASPFATIMSMIPPFTPMLMLIRQSTPAGVPAWQAWTSLAGVIFFTILCVWAGGRIFRVGILLQGQPPKIGTLVKWLVRG